MTDRDLDEDAWNDYVRDASLLLRESVESVSVLVEPYVPNPRNRQVLARLLTEAFYIIEYEMYEEGYRDGKDGVT